VKLAVRPDAVLIDESGPQPGEIAGQVRKASYLGTQIEYEVESPIGELFVVQYGRKEPIAAGTPVSISFALQRGVAIIPGA
jgi:iron(III) transport system ATP-binding protein